MSANWWRSPERAAGAIAPPGSREVHLWETTLEVCPAEVLEFLSADERDSAIRFRFELHRERYIAGRGFLRRVLARYLSCRPEELAFSYSRFGKPSLKLAAGLDFNVAHSADRLVLAVAATPIGVDIEKHRAALPDSLEEIEAMAKHVLSKEEERLWRTLSPTVRPKAFLNLWTRKEALLKGIGLGITQHVKDVSVFFGTEETVAVPPGLSTSAWTVRTLPQPDATISLATPFAPVRITPVADQATCTAT